jgi:hypothetical protein
MENIRAKCPVVNKNKYENCVSFGRGILCIDPQHTEIVITIDIGLTKIPEQFMEILCMTVKSVSGLQ